MRHLSILTFCAVALTGCGGGSELLPRATNENSAAFQSYEQIETAYTAVIPGKTTKPELSQLGLDVEKARNVEILSSVGVLERLPQSSRSSGHLPPQVQTCIDAQDRCMAYLIRSERIETRHVGNTLLELGGFESKTVRSGWSVEVVLLIQDERVIYKLMSGRPRIEDTRHSVRPLGPLHKVGEAVTETGSEKKD